MSYRAGAPAIWAGDASKASAVRRRRAVCEFPEILEEATA
jgi:hypothetical protein